MFNQMKKPFQKVVLSFFVLIMVSHVNAAGYNITLKDVEIGNFIEQVAKITGKTFVVDDRVRGKVTIVSSKNLPKEDVYNLFLSVLQVYGFVAVPSDSKNGIIKIVQNALAKQQAIPLGNGYKKGQELITKVIPIENTPAVELVSVLRPMVPSYGHLASANSANALIVIDHAQNIRVLERIIASLDQKKSKKMEVYSLENAWVGDVLQQVEQVVPVLFGSGKDKTNKSVHVIADERTNRVFIFGEDKARQQIKDLLAELDLVGEQTRSAQVIRLNYTKATEIADLLTRSMEASSGNNSKDKKAANTSNLSILADESTNSLIIRAETREMKEIKEILRQLDQRKAQVLIEAAILEVNADDAKALGFQWFSGNEKTGGAGINFSNFGNSVNSVVTGIATGGGSLADGITLLGGITDSNGNIDLAGLVQAVASVTKTNILSTPRLMTLDNEEASIIVGENVPFLAQSQASSSANSNPFVSVQREDVGITLKVLPSITEENTVRLEVTQEANQLDTASTAQTVDVVTTKREIETTILVDNEQTVMLGGLINDQSTESVSKVPLLGDIPIIGAFFRSKSSTYQKSNLLVFIKPTIIRTGEQASAIAAEQYGQLRDIQLVVDEYGEVSKFVSRTLPETTDELYQGLGNQ